MNEYELMLIVVGMAAAVAWVFFKYLARLVVWSERPKFDLMRYAFITLCLSIEIGDTFEWWEASVAGCGEHPCIQCYRINNVNAYDSRLKRLDVQVQGRGHGLS